MITQDALDYTNKNQLPSSSPNVRSKRLRNVIQARLKQSCAPPSLHDRRNELCDAVMDSLDDIKSGDNNFNMIDFLQIRNDACLMKPNSIVSERTSDKFPKVRNFSYRMVGKLLNILCFISYYSIIYRNLGIKHDFQLSPNHF